MENIRSPLVPQPTQMAFSTVKKQWRCIQAITERAVVAGWNEAEVTAALGDLADCWMVSMPANGDTDRMIREVALKYGVTKT